MSLSQLKPHIQYVDGQLITLPGPDNSTIGYQYDQQQRAFYARSSAVNFSGKHGSNHITNDPIPSATCSTPGLMSADDKCKLDMMLGTRIGIAGFAGAGFPDDGGFMSGDIIIAAGNEMISIERVGNVIRFVVDVPAIYSCGNEDCIQIYWVQDETDVNAIRPPINGGKLSGVNSYGELKVYLFPDSTVVNPADPSKVLNKKAFYPSFIFKRYDDGTGTNEGELDVTLKRNASGTAIVGWGFTPGATGIAECQWFLGTDSNNNRLAFKLEPNTTPGILGAILYNGHSLTKKSAIITGYDSTVVQTNTYKAKWWNMYSKSTTGSEFNVTNTSQWDLSNNSIILDSTVDSLLPVGHIIDVWSIKIGEVNGVPSYAHYCRERPPIDTTSLWTTVGAIEFGNELNAENNGSDIVDDLRTVETKQWGVDGLYPVMRWNGSAAGVLNSSYDVSIDSSIPCLKVIEDISGSEKTRPVTIWHRQAMRDAYMELHIARPDVTEYPPIDVLLRSPIDSFNAYYADVLSQNTSPGGYSGKYALLVNADYENIPYRGRFKILTGSNAGTEVEYFHKMHYDFDNTCVLITDPVSLLATQTIEFLREDYTTPAIRLNFTHNDGHDITLKPIVGTLDVANTGFGSNTDADNKVGMFLPGYAVGLTHWQDGATLSGTNGITTYPEGFVTYTGTGDSGGQEIFNILKVLVIDNAVWIWWNDLLMAPSRTDSALLPTPVDVNEPYFTISDKVKYGKFGLRLWPGAKVRRMVVRSRPTKFSQYSLGQVVVG